MAESSETRALKGGNMIAFAAIVLTIIGGVVTYATIMATVSANMAVLEKRAS